jgi:hypothetical protein
LSSTAVEPSHKLATSWGEIKLSSEWL